MFTLISSIAFTNIIYLLLGKLIVSKKNNDIRSISEEAIIGFIYLSLFALLVNFFSPLNPLINSIILFSIVIVFLIKKKKLNSKEIIFIITITFFGFFLILFDTVYRPDAGLYHLPFTRILNEEKIIFGLFNLHGRFGHISILQYSSALNNNIFFGDIGILIPLLSIYCFLTFYFLGDILNFIFNKKNIEFNYTSIYFSSLVLLYISYKINRYSEFGNDAIGHLLFFYLISKLINTNNFSYKNFSEVYLISIFTILNKVTLIFSALLPAYIFFSNKISFKKTIFSIPTLFLILWIIRNIITSSCVIYPQINTCFTDLTWSDKNKIIRESRLAEAWSKDWPNRINKDISMENYNKKFNWLSTWSKNHFNKFKNILIPYLVILLLIILYLRMNLKKKKLYNLSGLKLLFLISVIGSIIFFLKFPIYRYGYSYLITSIILISIFIMRSYDPNKIKNLCFFAIIIFFISYVYKQTSRINEYSATRSYIPKVYNEKKRYDQISLGGDYHYNISLNTLCMYDLNLCTIYKKNKFSLKRKYNYKFFINN